FDKSSTTPITFQQLFHHYRCQYSSFVPIFTDGSKSDGHVGCGVVFPSDTLSYRLHNCCSVFTAELVAIFCALQEILPSNQRNFILYTDSMSALETLSHYDNRIHPVALEILSVLQFLRNKGFNIIFCWVPSHVGISGNETADVIARFASDFLPRALPYCDIKKFLVSHLLSVWQQKWNLLTRNKLYPVKPLIGLWPALLMRELDVKLTRLRIGHTRFTQRHLFLGQRAPRCPTCHTDFTVNHILVECPSFKCHREYNFNSSSVTLQDLVARRLVKAQTPPDGKSYASVVDKSHPVYQTTNCPHCNHVVTMSNPVPSTSKSPEPVTIASSSDTKNKNILPKPSSQTSAVPPDSQDSSGFTVVNRKKKPKISSKSQSENNTQIKTNTAKKFWKNSPQTSASEKAKNKILKNKPEKQKNSTAQTANSTSNSSEETSSDTDTDLTIASAPEASNIQKNRARSKSEKSQKLKQAKRGLSQKDLPVKLKKSAHHNSVALGLADRGIAHKDLLSIFGGVPQVPDLKLHPSLHIDWRSMAHPGPLCHKKITHSLTQTSFIR
ncbi:hypothetical protein AVEN_168017-1, partial [Araneus ventricosus]